MDPRDRAEAQLARARARGAHVVTPDSATSPMDASNTVQIPRVVVNDADPRQGGRDATMVLPPGAAPGAQPAGPPQHLGHAPQQRTSAPPPSPQQYGSPEHGTHQQHGGQQHGGQQQGPQQQGDPRGGHRQQPHHAPPPGAQHQTSQQPGMQQQNSPHQGAQQHGSPERTAPHPSGQPHQAHPQHPVQKPLTRQLPGLLPTVQQAQPHRPSLAERLNGELVDPGEGPENGQRDQRR
ncbi:hypothetical protein [Gandjariella thermophila]|uniref:Uncharacterized protein n=1 Tax=Gandjariella thermophila TaxID=1931992 RepID=A0A4D4JBT9_9PSEU|nr:hypothetical protein [Gandjariella thermophila]GDY31323.1 hypothetical protein GTS_29560 [Gandjariella thermophila]